MQFWRLINVFVMGACICGVLLTGFIIWEENIYKKLHFLKYKTAYPVRNNTRLWSNVSDGLVKTDVHADSCTRLPNATKSLAIPPHYPKNGTGIIVTTKPTYDFTKVNKLCQNHLEAILPVYSAVGNYARRSAIRNTTGQSCEQYKCKVVFIVGFSKDGLLSQELKAEYERYGDILIVNRVDTYRNLNDKAVAMLNWLIEVCSQPKYVIHFVDDTFVNIKLFLEDLKSLSNAVYGYIARRFGPIRDARSKYYVSKTEYPYGIYPNFVIGVAYAFPNSIAKSLRCAVHDAIYNWLEDVWLMGHVRELAGIKAVHTTRKEQRFGPINMKDADKYLYIHSVQVDDFYQLHQMLTIHEHP